MKLWYDSPTYDWTRALPAGNGFLGCMHYGSIQEHFQLNEDSVWNGGPSDRFNPDAPAALPEVRRLLREGQIAEAEELAFCAFSSLPNYQRSYQTLGDLYIDHPKLKNAEYTDYRRELELETGLLSAAFTANNTRYTRRAFVSYPDRVMVVTLEAVGEEKLHLLCRLDRNHTVDKCGKVGRDTIWFTCDRTEGIAFTTMLRCADTDGETEIFGEVMRIKNATRVTLLLTAATTFREADPFAWCEKTLTDAAEMDADTLYARHLADFRPKMEVMRLTLGDNARDLIPTDRRREEYAAGAEDPGLEALYFQYCRYLLLSSSRPGSLPANLQGIWNKEYYPPWDSKFTININAEMNYWPAESCGLSETHLPFFDLLKRIQKNGAVTAEKMYGCRGFVAHHNTDIWADTYPQDQYIPGGYWVMGAAWMATHIWQHYRYTLDRKFLADQFDTLEQCVLFFVDFMERDERGYYVTNPSVSPENTYILPSGEFGAMCVGATMDMQILRELFTNYLDSAKILGVENEITAAAAERLAGLYPTQIGTDGRLLEWREEYEEMEPGHRHISHLFGLAPGSEIHPDSTPELAAAARKTLEYRLSHGGGHTGWSCAWITLLWARLQDAALAHESLRKLLSASTFPNLMDNHPLFDYYVFQIDGNFGAASAMAEFLVQSGTDFIRLLPALPAAWREGSVEGIRLPGAARADLRWENGRLTDAVITADADWEQTVLYGDRRVEVRLKAGEKYCFFGK